MQNLENPNVPDTGDTIAAPATARGQAGVGIIRISGPASLDIAKKLFKPAKKKAALAPLRLIYGTIKDPKTNSVIDSAYLVYMKAPRSYTGEDTIELQCHGGPLVLKKVLEAVVASGASHAEPGEFTKRAFLNGKLDLSQAEAVSELIRAKSDAALAAARGRLGGALSAKINEIKEILLGLLTGVEAELDFPEDELEAAGDAGIFSDALTEAARALTELIQTYGQGRALTDGVSVLILGRPNVGKSSLLNILLKEERAIVTEVPGTTRDLITETVLIKGIPIRLMDTAGLRATTDRIESIGVEKAREGIERAELIIFVVDSSAKDYAEDLKMLESVSAQAGEAESVGEHKKIIVAANKTDLIKREVKADMSKKFSPYPIVFISALKEQGIGGLEDKIHEEIVGEGQGCRVAERSPGELITTARHFDVLRKTLEAVERTRQGVEKELPREIVAVDLRWSVDHLGLITGETTTEDILERIFSSFCIGK